MNHSEDTQIQLNQMLRFVLRRRGIILLTAVATFCASLVALSFVPPGYQSFATIMILDRESFSRPVEEVMGGAQKTRDYREEQNRAAQISSRMRSFPFLARVVKTLRMTEDPDLLEQARRDQKNSPGATLEDIATRLLVERVRNHLLVESRGPGIVRITVTDPEAKTAQLLARWISELFIDITTSKEMEQIRSVRRFGDEQLRIYQQEVETAENALERYRASRMEASLGSGIIQQSNLADAESQHRRLMQDVGESEVRISYLGRKATEAGYTGQFTEILDDSEARRLSGALTGAMDREVLLQLTRGDLPSQDAAAADVTTARNMLYRGVQERMRLLQPSLAPAVQEAVSAYAFTWLDVEARKASAAHLKGDIDDFRRQVRSKPADEIELARLQAQVNEKRKLLDSFRAQTVASDVSQAVASTNLGLRIEILDPAQVPLQPATPNRMRIMALALLMGPLLGIGFAFFAELLDPTLRTLADIRRVAPETVLGTIPLLVPTAPEPHAIGIRRHWVALAVGGVVLMTALTLTLRATVLARGISARATVNAIDPDTGGHK